MYFVENILGYVPLTLYVFMLFATITVVGAGGVAFSQNIVYSAFSLLAAFTGVVGLFAFMSADFLAVVQLMVYVGGILVLILFAVMLTNRITDVQHSNPLQYTALGLTVLILLGTIMGTAVLGYEWSTVEVTPAYAPTSEAIGAALLGPYLLPFEVAGILLLAALVAAVVVARKEVKDLAETGSTEQGDAS
jgi:NAD(P)H-quinone oxidoreductase subunit 6